MINIENLSKNFGDLKVLKNISTTVNKGEVISIIGPSGSGKSTFLRCINKLEEPTEGHIYIDGMDLMDKNTDINKIRERVGMVFQHFNLFPNMTVLENLYCKRRAYDEKYSFYANTSCSSNLYKR